MAIDFEAFKKTIFYKLGSAVYDPVTDSFKYHPVCAYYIMTNSVDIVKNNESYHDGTIRPAPPLAKLLNVSVPMDVKQSIIKQWTEVSNIVNRIKINPSMAHLFILPANNPVPAHTHSVSCKQILTFMYRFSEYLGDRYQNSQLEVEDKIYVYPNVDKAYFSIYDNQSHCSVSNEWRFFWSYDYEQYVDVPNDIDFINMKVSTPTKIE